mgnify:CR=1 FL=1
MIAKALERQVLSVLAFWRALSLDARVVGVLGVGNWLLLFFNHTTVQATRDDVLWRLFPGVAGPLWLALCGALAIAYPLRDRRSGPAFTARGRALHLAAIVVAFAVLPTLASIVLRETGKPYTYVHDGAIMVEEAARKLLHGQNPYGADYLDTPLVFWPMVNNPALYHFTYFPDLFLITAPFTALFDRLGLFWDERYLYLPAYLATCAVAPLLVSGADRRLALAAAIALNPQLFPFVVEGRNDFFVLAFVFGGLVLLQRERRSWALLLLAMAASAKLHAALLLPFVAVYLIASRRPTSLRAAWSSLWRPAWPASLLMAAVFLPFLTHDFGAFWDDVVRYNAGGAAWSYPIAGMGFSALLLVLGIIPSRQADFPFALFELAAAVPLGIVALRALWREPTLARMLLGHAVTLLAFLFFGRYFHGNYAGYVAALATPALFLRAGAPPPRRPRPPAAATAFVGATAE